MNISDTQLSRLPELFQDIITNQRAIEAYCCEPLVAVEHFVRLRNRQTALAQTAARRWAPLATKGGPATA